MTTLEMKNIVLGGIRKKSKKYYIKLHNKMLPQKWFTSFEQSGDRMILKIALHKKRREWFSGLWESSKGFDYPFAF